MAILTIDHASKIYGTDVQVRAVNDLSMNMEEGEFVAIMGASGSGKSTLLNLISGILPLSSGEIRIDGRYISCLGESQAAEFRRNELGFVFQFYNLVQNLTALENVELASQICKDPLPADEALALVGLTARMDNFPSQLSGGEQQRVAIARALAKRPKLLLCDEPTGALDYKTGKAILELLQNACERMGCTVVLVPHNTAFAGVADRVIHVRGGHAAAVETNEHPQPASTIEW